jgi:hypothetical protein
MNGIDAWTSFSFIACGAGIAGDRRCAGGGCERPITEADAYLGDG